jgi:hypothetical protein
MLAKLRSLAAFAVATHYEEVSVVDVSSLSYFSENYSTGYQAEFTELLFKIFWQK